MKKLILAAAVSCLALAACSEADMTKNETGDVSAEDNGALVDGNGAAVATTGSSAFPKGARIVEEGGVTYRIDADGTRVKLGDTDSKIVIENKTRYRVDPDGTRVRIDDQGLDIDLPDVTPDVDVGINDKGNPDIDVKTDGDNNAGPD
ncbi:MAG TPA: hypothetical protein VIT45_15250 [Allosphingosinicella sp.]